MSTFSYEIIWNHIKINHGDITSWYYIGSMKGIPYARISDQNGPGVGGGAVPPPGNVITISIHFPDQAGGNFHIPFNTHTEAGRIMNKAEQLIKDIIVYIDEKETTARLEREKAAELASQNDKNNTQKFFGILETVIQKMSEAKE